MVEYSAARPLRCRGNSTQISIALGVWRRIGLLDFAVVPVVLKLAHVQDISAGTVEPSGPSHRVPGHMPALAAAVEITISTTEASAGTRRRTVSGATIAEVAKGPLPRRECRMTA